MVRVLAMRLIGRPVFLLGVGLLCSSTASAQQHEHVPSTHRLTSEGSLGVGWLVLPVTSVCTSGGCVRPDTSFLFHLTGFVHIHKNWAVGASGHFALFPTSNPPQSLTSAAVSRELSRAYMMLTAQARFYPLRQSAALPKQNQLNPYLGLDLGWALLTDRYKSPAVDTEGALRIGDPGYTVHSEGLASRLLLGSDWGLGGHFALGFEGQAGVLWFPQAETTPLEDQGTVTGLELSVSAALSFKAYLEL